MNTDMHLINKKNVVQFILALLVFFIHFKVFSVFIYKGERLTALFNILSSLTHVAVPLFFIISGAFFYRNYTFDKTIYKWKNRFVSILLPYLIWNSFWFFLALLGYYTPLGKFLGGVKTAFTLNSMIDGILLYGFFEPFWFLYQLIVLIVMCPVIYLFMKNKYVGLSMIFVFVVMYSQDVLCSNVLFPNPSMVIFYLLGTLIGLHYFEHFCDKKSNSIAILCLISYILCCIFFYCYKHLWALNTVLHSETLFLIIEIISCWSFWTAFDLFDFESYPKYMNDSFLVYAMHSLIGATVAKILYLCFPKDECFVFLTAIITFPVTIIIICVLGILLRQYFPRTKFLLTGR